MPKTAIRLSLSLPLLFSVAQTLNAQIIGSFPPSPVSCRDEEVDTSAVCSRIYFCTKPPNPIDQFVIGAFAFKTCPNQPVVNVARVDAAIGGSQASADGLATALFFGRRIKEQLSLGDCNGKATLVI